MSVWYKKLLTVSSGGVRVWSSSSSGDEGEGHDGEEEEEGGGTRDRAPPSQQDARHCTSFTT